MESLYFKIAEDQEYLKVEFKGIPDGHWIDVQVDIIAGSFKGLFEASFDDLSFVSFKDQLISLHKTLNGNAEFNTLERQLKIKVNSDGLGHFGFLIEAADKASFEAVEIKYSLDIDQTQLPLS